jgi:hypothetical protein
MLSEGPVGGKRLWTGLHRIVTVFRRHTTGIRDSGGRGDRDSPDGEEVTQSGVFTMDAAAYVR